MNSARQLDVKICGLKTPEAVEAALNGGANHIGFIFFPKSPRHLEPGKAAPLRIIVKDQARVVAVSVDAGNAMLDDIVSTVKPDLLQLHGSESLERVAEIKARYGLPVMKAFAIRNAADLEAARPYEGVIERFLFDAKPPEGSDLPGGNGVQFDWQLLKNFKSKTPVMLSGGLDRTNIAEAILTARPGGVDISSGVETSPGVKDIGLIKAFMDEVAQVATSPKQKKFK